MVFFNIFWYIHPVFIKFDKFLIIITIALIDNFLQRHYFENSLAHVNNLWLDRGLYNCRCRRIWVAKYLIRNLDFFYFTNYNIEVRFFDILGFDARWCILCLNLIFTIVQVKLCYRCGVWLTDVNRWWIVWEFTTVLTLWWYVLARFDISIFELFNDTQLIMKFMRVSVVF